jgi:hypothetical protein
MNRGEQKTKNVGGFLANFRGLKHSKSKKQLATAEPSKWDAMCVTQSWQQVRQPCSLALCSRSSADVPCMLERYCGAACACPGALDAAETPWSTHRTFPTDPEEYEEIAECGRGMSAAVCSRLRSDDGHCVVYAHARPAASVTAKDPALSCSAVLDGRRYIVGGARPMESKSRSRSWTWTTWATIGCVLALDPGPGLVPLAL